MDIDAFRQSMSYMVGTIKADLDKLESIAQNVPTTITETTKAPGVDYDINPPPVDVSRCTVPMAMVCFSAIDMFGQFVNDVPTDDFSVSSESFFKKLADRDDLKNSQTQEWFKKDIRHSVMHSFFPISGKSISYMHHDRGSLTNGSGELHVEYLVNVVKLGMDKFLEKINGSEVEEIKVRYENWVEEWTKK